MQIYNRIIYLNKIHLEKNKNDIDFKLVIFIKTKNKLY